MRLRPDCGDSSLRAGVLNARSDAAGQKGRATIPNIRYEIGLLAIDPRNGDM